MPEPDDYTEGGQPVYRYGDRKIPFQHTIGDSDVIKAVEEHITRHVGPIDSVWHELVSDLVHIDVHVVKPGPGRPYTTLVTSGMSAAPMNAQGKDGPFQSHAELCILLPEGWKLGQEDLKDFANYFPIQWLKFLARFPHEHDTWLGYGHTMPNGDPAEPLAPHIGFTGWILLPPVRLGREFFTLELDEQRTIEFYAILPLYTEEMDYKLKHGAEALCDFFDQRGVTELIDIHRPSALISFPDQGEVPRPWWKRLFGQ